MSHGLDSALVAYLVAGFFVTVLYYPFFWINLAFTVSLYHTTTLELRRQGAVATGAGQSESRPHNRKSCAAGFPSE